MSSSWRRPATSCCQLPRRAGVSALPTYDQKLALMRCLFEVSATDEAISTAEEGEIDRIANELRINPPDLVALRVAPRRHLPGVSRAKPFSHEYRTVFRCKARRLGDGRMPGPRRHFCQPTDSERNYGLRPNRHIPSRPVILHRSRHLPRASTDGSSTRNPIKLGCSSGPIAAATRAGIPPLLDARLGR